nr:probable leucine-rich repeat receptor-like protein kinase At1g35710 [Populus alba]
MASQIFLLCTPFLFFSLLAYASFFASFAYSASTGAAEVANGRKEAEALLEWKVSLDNQSQSLLSSWAGDSPCNWFGISCDKSGSVTNISLNSLIFSSFPNLIELILRNNSLYGSIPSHIGNLIRLDLSLNSISGSIPPEVGKLVSLYMLDLSNNNLSGALPTSIGNLSNLSYLYLYGNELSGFIPREVGMLEHLSALQLLYNNFEGPIPASIGNLRSLTSLLLSFKQLRSLSVLDLANNNLFGPIPPEMNNLTHLYSLQIFSNRLSGNLPQDVCLGGLLSRFAAANNYFTGPIPKSLKNCSSLVRLRLERNQLSGNISEAFGKHPNLNYMELSDNELHGELSWKWEQFNNLAAFRIFGNKISGEIPAALGKATYLQALDLSSNQLAGRIPKELGNLKFIELALNDNKLSGDIPFDVASLSDLERLGLAANNFSGTILKQLGKCSKLIFLNIKGPIPDIKAFREAPFEAIRNNTNLCGNATGLEACSALMKNKAVHKKGPKVVFLTVFSLLGSLLGLIVGFLIFFQSRRKKRLVETPRRDVTARWCPGGDLRYEDIIEATEEFDSKYCIGTGGYGVVYKAVLPSEQVLAVKKFHQTPEVEMSSLKPFRSEIDVIMGIRHRNIVNLYGFCSHAKHSFLVYEFVERESLRKVLNDEEQAGKMDWDKRMNLIKGVANALSYMHHDCSPPIIHRDISSNNVLLDSEYEDHVSDFGTARLLMPDSSNWTSFAGTFGYTAPGM